jgi:tetratricopeptide (TPR) repeat protein
MKRCTPLESADAYVLLAEPALQQGQWEEARTLLERGLHAGERALGVERFSRDIGRFWNALDTRAYLRARARLAIALWEQGELAEAAGHARAVLLLDPTDNQGMRDFLQDWLIVLGEDEAARRLLARYPNDGGARRAFTLALLAFRASGRCDESTDALVVAVATNAHVPRYLLEIAPMPQHLADASAGVCAVGSESEAVVYAQWAQDAWEATDHALEWLEGMTQEPEQPPQARTTKKAPSVKAPSARGARTRRETN